MTDIWVLGLSRDCVAALKKRARVRGRSLNATIKELLSDAASADQAVAAWERIREIWLVGHKRWKGPSLLEMLHEDRDRRCGV
jgi:hypothetical protein